MREVDLSLPGHDSEYIEAEEDAGGVELSVGSFQEAGDDVGTLCAAGDGAGFGSAVPAGLGSGFGRGPAACAVACFLPLRGWILRSAIGLALRNLGRGWRWFRVCGCGGSARLCLCGTGEAPVATPVLLVWI